MRKRLKLKPFVVPMIYMVVIIAIMIGIFFSVKTLENKDDITYVSKAILDEYVPVVNEPLTKIGRPYTDSNVSVLNGYYDYTTDNNQSAIIYYENTYVQNTGINYTFTSPFEVVSILDGEVIDIKEDKLLGKTITIKHDKDVVSIYSMVDNVKVKKGDKVLANDVIAESGKSEILKDDFNLHFELCIKGEVVNPEYYYDKELKDLN